MIWVIFILAVVIVFVVYKYLTRLQIEKSLMRASHKNVFSKRSWLEVPFGECGAPMRMAFSEIASKSVYQSNFKVMFRRFIDAALIADDTLDPDEVSRLVESLYSDLSAIKFLGAPVKITRDYGMVQAATLYALICTQDKGRNIKQRLMDGKNSHDGTGMYVQHKTDREYFEYMNERYANFCQLVSILEPRKSVLLEAVAGYLLSE